MEVKELDASASAVMPQQHFVLSDTSHVGEARRIAIRAGQRLGLAEQDCGRIAIIASELATNIIRHAQRGEMLLHAHAEPAKAVELIAIDSGPGMADLARCMADGYSTAGSLGHGLGAVRRLSEAMDIYSAPSRGTAVYCRVEADRRGARSRKEESPWYAIRVAAPGETECGDEWRVSQSKDFVSAVLADGLGHGSLAARAAGEAMAVFEQSPFDHPESYLAKAHHSLRTTRGAALACARLERRSRTLLFGGVGNISARILNIQTQVESSLTSLNGTIGVQIGKLRQFEYPAVEDALLLMHSDGLTSRWKLGDYPGLSRRLPVLIAAVLYRDFKRGRDDATVLVVRLK